MRSAWCVVRNCFGRSTGCFAVLFALLFLLVLITFLFCFDCWRSQLFWLGNRLHRIKTRNTKFVFLLFLESSL
jgi:hypothetical protein